MRVHLSRWVCLDVESNLARLREEAAGAARDGADWAVFPESFLNGYTRRADPAKVRAVFGEISAAYPATVFFFGSISENRRNRMTVWRDGREAARYDKVHLFGPNGENDLWDPGDRYALLDLGGLRVGLLNCNDLRFPEQARTLKLKGRADAFVAVAWWPWRRTSVWEALLRARAIENGAWVFGCCLALSRWPGEDFAGAGNYAFDPLGEPIRTEDDRAYDVDFARAPSPVVDSAATHVDIEKVEVFGGSLEV